MQKKFTQIHFIIAVGVVAAADVGNETTLGFKNCIKDGINHKNFCDFFNL
jgi:hypothetical protein